MHDGEQEFSLRKLFTPLTTIKAVHIIGILGIIVFFNTLFNGFVWDDKSFILNNSEVHSLNLLKIFSPSIFNDSSYFRPMPALYFTLMYSMFKETSFFYHIFQIVLHITCSSLIFLLFRKYFNKELALIVSIIFLIHPMQVESVSYIAQTVSPLFFLFGVTALFYSLADNISARRVVVIFTFLLLSLLTKESGFLFMFTILLATFLFYKRRLKGFIFCSFLITCIYFLVRFGIGHVYFAKIGTVPIAKLSLAERLVHIPNIIFYYLKTFLLPFHLTIEQRWIIKTTTGNNFYLPLLIDTLFFLFFIVIGRFVWKKDRKAFRIFVLFSFWFIAGIFMLLQVFPLDMTVADRWFYFPMVGLLGMIGISMQAIMGKISRKNMYIGYGIAISIILLLSLRTIVRNANWVNAITLYSHDSKIYDNDEIENNLGNEYYAEHNYREALRHFKKSVELYPNATNLSNLGSIYEIFNDKASARKYFYMILNTDAYSKNTYDYFLVYASSVLLHSDSPEIANDFTYKALKKAPHTGYLWANKAISEYKQLNQKEALAAAERAKSLTPNAQTNYLYTLISEEKEIPEDMVFQLQ